MTGVQITVWILTVLAMAQGVVLIILWLRSESRHDVTRSQQETLRAEYESLQSQADWLQQQFEELVDKPVPTRPVKLRKVETNSSYEVLQRYNEALRKENKTLMSLVEEMQERRAERKKLEERKQQETEVELDANTQQ